jgi:L-ascorbate metabolism protein UlaG (beta-lactamase superfamily)
MDAAPIATDMDGTVAQKKLVSIISAVRVRRLSWAGVEITSGASRLLIDPLEDPSPLRDFLGTPRAPLLPISIHERTWAAVTHLHPDHCDRTLLRRLAGKRVFCHEPIKEPLELDGIRATAARLWRSIDAGPFRLTPVPSQDWRGDDQIAWIVEVDGHRLIHCGDTIWHGRWYEIARHYHSFDAAFLPINGVLTQLPGFTPTSVPATLTPEQAIEAALVLRARLACPIHHGLFHSPPRYVEQHNALARFRTAARRRGIEAVAPRDGEPVPIR